MEGEESGSRETDRHEENHLNEMQSPMAGVLGTFKQEILDTQTMLFFT